MSESDQWPTTRDVDLVQKRIHTQVAQAVAVPRLHGEAKGYRRMGRVRGRDGVHDQMGKQMFCPFLGGESVAVCAPRSSTIYTISSGLLTSSAKAPISPRMRASPVRWR
jgi:hypothetical protein